MLSNSSTAVTAPINVEKKLTIKNHEKLAVNYLDARLDVPTNKRFCASFDKTAFLDAIVRIFKRVSYYEPQNRLATAH